MRKLAIVLMCIAILSGCGKEQIIDLTKENAVIQSINFDREEATKLVEEIEAPINELKIKETLTKEMYNALKEQLEELYPNPYARDILKQYVSDETTEPIQVRQDVDYPTLNQEGIEIIQVFIERKEYDAIGKEGPPPIPKDDKKDDKGPELENKELGLGNKEIGLENKERLIIEEGYIGDDEGLKDFKRVYKFRKSKEDIWKLENIEVQLW